MFEFMEETITDFEIKRKGKAEKSRKVIEAEPNTSSKGEKSGKERKRLEWKELVKPLDLPLDGDRKLNFSITQDVEETKEPKVNIRIMYLTKDGEYRHTVQGFTFPLEFLESFREELDKLEIACTEIGI